MKFFNRGGKDRPITPKTVRDVSDDEIEAGVSIADEDDLEEFAREKAEGVDDIQIGDIVEYGDGWIGRVGHIRYDDDEPHYRIKDGDSYKYWTSVKKPN